MRTLSDITAKSRLPNRLAKPILGIRFQQVSGLKGVKSMLMVLGIEVVVGIVDGDELEVLFGVEAEG